MGVPEAEVTPWLDQLFDHALAWPDDEGRIRVVGGVARWWTAPCGLGEPLTHYLNSWTVSADALRGLARTLGLPNGPKRRTIARVAEILSDPEQVTALVERAPEGTRRLLEEFAWDGPVRTVDGGRFVVPGAPEKWAADHGLIFRPSWNVAEMPREVSLALRGPDYHPPFTPGPPDLGTIPVDPEAVDHLMTLAAPHVVERCAAMLENTAKVPLPLLKAGGVGVREVRRVAKDTGCDEDETRLLLEICAVARLLAWDDSAAAWCPPRSSTAGGWTTRPPGSGCCCRRGGAWNARRSAGPTASTAPSWATTRRERRSPGRGGPCSPYWPGCPPTRPAPTGRAW
ncbi:hypothetical protein ACFQX6_25415 [Streptosporangium lutulentum]